MRSGKRDLDYPAAFDRLRRRQSMHSIFNSLQTRNNSSFQLRLLLLHTPLPPFLQPFPLAAVLMAFYDIEASWSF
jgi:hypothetical protein